MKKSTVITLFCIAMILGMISGIVASIIDRGRLQEAQINEIKKYNELIGSNAINTDYSDEIVATNSQNIKLSPNATICFERHYIECGHTIVQKERITEEEVNKDEEYFKTAYSDWNIEKFTAEEVKLSKDVPGRCNEHYIISIKDQNIAVFTVDSEGKEILKEVTDIPIQYLPKEDVELLEKGIKAYGENELSKILEDYE